VQQESYDYGLWGAVAFNVVFFAGFVLARGPAGNVNGGAWAFSPPS